MCTGGQQISRELEDGYRLFTLHAGKGVEKLVERVPGSQVVEEVLQRHPGSTKDGRASQDLRIAVHDRL